MVSGFGVQSASPNLPSPHWRISLALPHGFRPAPDAPGEVGKGGSESIIDLESTSAAAEPWLPMDMDVPDRNPPELLGGEGRPERFGCVHTSAGSA